MKNILYFICLLNFFGFSQNTSSKYSSGVVEYEIFIEGSESIDTVKNSTNKTMLTRIKNILDSKSFILKFNKNESLFSAVKSMAIENADNDPILKIADLLSRQSTIYYRNNKDNIKFKQVELSGKKIIVNEEVKQDWIITKEFKEINGYKCFRAYKEIKEFNPTTNQTRVFYPTVWFCPQLNFPYGPIGLDGLPGLVLEGTINNKFLYIAKSLNFKEVNIDVTNLKGEKMSNKEYHELLNNLKF